MSMTRSIFIMLTFISFNYSKLTDFETTTDRSTTTEKIGTTLKDDGTTESISTETALKFARVPVISDADCKQYYTGKKTSLETTAQAKWQNRLKNCCRLLR